MSNTFRETCVEAQPLIAVHDVRASSRWYSALLNADGLPEHPHRDRYDRIFCCGKLLLQLHAWDVEDHPNLVDPQETRPGHGVLLWFEVTDFDAALDRIDSLKADIVEGPLVNPAPMHREIWLSDPDGYVVVIASRDGEAGS